MVIDKSIRVRGLAEGLGSSGPVKEIGQAAGLFRGVTATREEEILRPFYTSSLRPHAARRGARLSIAKYPHIFDWKEFECGTEHLFTANEARKKGKISHSRRV